MGDRTSVLSERRRGRKERRRWRWAKEHLWVPSSLSTLFSLSHRENERDRFLQSSLELLVGLVDAVAGVAVEEPARGDAED